MKLICPQCPFGEINNVSVQNGKNMHSISIILHFLVSVQGQKWNLHSDV